MNPSFSFKSLRLDVVDALRGFAVMAILLVHSLEHFLYFVYPDPATLPGWLNALNTGTFTVIFSLFAGKSYAIFALLFGLTYSIQFNNQQLRQKDFAWRFVWRLLLLACFATLNAVFFPGGDVLLLFSIVGLVLILARKWSDKSVLVLAVVLVCQPMEWFYYLRYLVDASYGLPEQMNGALYGVVGEAVNSGNPFKMFWENITTGQAASLFWAIENGRFLQTAGLFLLGFLLGRRRLFEANDGNYKFWTAALIWGAILFGPLYALKVDLYDRCEVATVKQTVGVVLDMWQKFAFTVVLVASFVILYQKVSFRKLTDNLRWYGRMSLTNYISQSVFGALLFSPFGIYVSPYWGYFLSALLGLCFFVVQVKFCKWWLKGHKQGPLEALWHKLTWIGTGK